MTPETRKSLSAVLSGLPVGDLIMTALVWYVIAAIVLTLGTAAIICAIAQKTWKLAHG